MNAIFSTAACRLCLGTMATLLLLAAPALSPNAHAEDVDLSLPDAINIAGKQRMLSQRMVSFYAMLGLNVNVDDSKNKLQAAVSLFDTQVSQLQHIAGVDHALSFSYKESISTEWAKVRQLAGLTPTKKRAAQLRQLADVLLVKSNDFVLQLEDVSGSSQGKLVNLAGRQRMLSQRIAGMYMENVWEVSVENITAKKERAQHEFDEALQQLQETAENTTEITKLLGLVAGQWHAFTAINKLKNKAYAQPAMVAQAADSILELMNTVTGLYAKL
ncbi:MAG: type IV pili methyl-accepting chemotaxis transducer N-terminal domain-containing protein [Mariprofundaceae bacterium]|nr:type IV pili methyl-accepting chemotaxis transducer N-terminal domain-containing protein [Mariprofundaceae bacterium]